MCSASEKLQLEKKYFLKTSLRTNDFMLLPIFITEIDSERPEI